MPNTKSHKSPGQRVLPRPKYKSFKVSKRITYPHQPVQAAPKVFMASVRHLRQSWKLYSGILLIYLVLTLVFVKGFAATTNLSELKASIHQLIGGGSLTTGLTLFGVLLGSGNNGTGETGTTYQTILLVIMSLALIWTIRQRFADHKVTLRDSFYRSMYPLIPFLLVIVVIMLQLLPLVIGNLLYSTVMGNGLAIGGLEKFLWLMLYLLLAVLSLYMVTSSIFALYIVTLPDIRPVQALRSARDVVRYRRWLILRKLLFLPLVLIVVGLIILLPIILWLTPLAEWVFLVLSLACVPVVHAYIYSLYRELI